MFFLADATSASASDLGAMVGDMIDKLAGIGLNMYTTSLGPEMLALAYELIAPILIVQITLVSIKIMMMQADPIQELSKLFIRTFIIAAIMITQAPQIAIGNTMFAMEKVGQKLGVQIAKSGSWSPGTDAGKDAMKNLDDSFASDSSTTTKTMPIVALWDAWLKDGTLPTNTDQIFNDIIKKAGGNTNPIPAKFTSSFIRNRIFGKLTKTGTSTTSTTSTSSDGSSSAGAEYDFYTHQGAAESKFTADEAFATLKKGTFAKEIGDVITKEGANAASVIFSVSLAIMQPLSTIGIAMAMATMMLSATLAPQVAAMTSIGCVYFVFFLIASLSIGMIPLLYFDSFARTWVNLMQTLIGLALVPFFFHIMSGVGFAIMTTAFEVMFPVGAETATFPAMLNGMMSANWIQSLLIQLSVDPSKTDGGGLIQGLLDLVLRNAMAMMLMIGRQVVGVSIISSFILGGVSISASAVGVAMSWKEFFAHVNILQSIQQGLLQVQTGISSGMGAAYSQGMQAVGSAGNAISSFANPGKGGGK